MPTALRFPDHLCIGAAAGGITGAVIGAAAGFFSERRSVCNHARSIEPPEEF